MANKWIALKIADAGVRGYQPGDYNVVNIFGTDRDALEAARGYVNGLESKTVDVEVGDALVYKHGSRRGIKPK